MQKNVLLIESDTPFARAMSKALESRGYGVRTSPDGKEGFELARALHPDCVVLCVELPGLSGYSWCNRLKKDGDLKSIPLVITSSEATPETFDQHRKLKTRAEDYLLKPFPPETLVERVATLVGLPDAVPQDEELITMDDVELEGVSSGGEPAAEEDADLKLLDDAFDNISRGGDEPGSGAPASEPPLTLMPEADESPALSDFDREMAAALASLAEEAAEASRVEPLAPSPRKVEPRVESVAQDETPILLEDVEVIPLVDEGTAAALQAAEEAAAALRGELASLRAEGDRLHEEAARLRAEGGEAQRLLALREGEVAEVRARLQASVEQSSRAEARSAELEGELAGLRSKLSAAEMSATARGAELVDAEQRTEELEREIEAARAETEGLRAEVESLRSSADGVRGEAAGLRNEVATLGATVEALRGEAERSRGDSEILRAEADGLRAEGESLRAELASFRAQAESIRAEADGLRAEGEGLRAELASFRAQAESLRAEGESFRAEVVSLQADGESLRAEVASVRADADSRVAEAAAFRSELQASRAAAEAFRAEAEARATELSRHIQEIEGQASQHEERVLRAYQKIKSDEKLREKTRKALAMVLQILEERPGGDAGS